MCHLLLTLKKSLANALRFVTDVVLNILPCSADFTRVDGPTILEVLRELHLRTEARNSFLGLGVYLLKSKFRIEDKLRFP